MINWIVEDTEFWNEKGRSIAYRNLFFSATTLLLAFVIWMLWSSVIVFLQQVRADISSTDAYLLTAFPLLSAAILRLPYSFVVPWVGGRNWNTISMGILLVPLILFAMCLIHELSIGWLYFTSLLTGIAGANFASSCSNITYLFPYRFKSIALGINSSVGNLGVGVAQWFIPFLILLYSTNANAVEKKSLLYMTYVLISLTVFSTLLSHIFMTNVEMKKTSLRKQLLILKDIECWNMCLLYTFTFGAYIGLASIFPLLISKYFSIETATTWAFIGAVLSALMRPMGHVVAKYTGSVKATLISFSLLVIGMYGVIHSLFIINSLPVFIFSYMMLFLGTGLGKGTTTAMIPEIYMLAAENKSDSVILATQNIASVVGVSSAIATFGAFLIPLAFERINNYFSNEVYGMGLLIFCFISCFVFTLLRYGRKTKTNPLVKVVNGKNTIIDCPSKMKIYVERRAS